MPGKSMENRTATKADLAQALTDRIGFNKHQSKHLVDEVFEMIREALESGREVKLSGFGHFVLRDKNARPGRNPKTGEEVAVTARRVVAFHPSSKFRAAVAMGNRPEQQ